MDCLSIRDDSVVIFYMFVSRKIPACITNAIEGASWKIAKVVKVLQVKIELVQVNYYDLNQITRRDVEFIIVLFSDYRYAFGRKNNIN